MKDTRAAVSVSLVQLKEELASAVTSASETAKVISACITVAIGCFRILTPGKRPRAGEIEGLNNAQAVLAGADYSL